VNLQHELLPLADRQNQPPLLANLQLMRKALTAQKKGAGGENDEEMTMRPARVAIKFSRKPINMCRVQDIGDVLSRGCRMAVASVVRTALSRVRDILTIVRPLDPPFTVNARRCSTPTTLLYTWHGDAITVICHRSCRDRCACVIRSLYDRWCKRDSLNQRKGKSPMK
jgi:hypothetical protein